ncbi:MAG: LysR family transcriptional regulator [Myxococcales bacterium]|nr:LysR family transcriptional regulator [Myxococcales bacterium]
MTTPRLDADWLYAFTVFAEHLNFTHAAQALHLSQPALHVQIKRLGEQVGAVLYRRRGRSIELTEAGRRVLAFAREQGDATARFLDALHGRNAERPAVLCAGEGACLYLLGPAIARFAGDLRLRVRDGEGTLAALLAAEVDVGVLVAQDALPAELEAAPLASVGQCALFPPDHALAGRTTLKARDLARERLILPPPGRPLRAAFERAVETPPEIAVEVTGWPLALHFAALGLGVAVVNAFCPTPPGLVAVPIADLPPRRYLAVRRRAMSYAPAAVRLWTALGGQVAV